jgi:hypothetical protein
MIALQVIYLGESTVGVTTEYEVKMTEEEMKVICFTVIYQLSKITNALPYDTWCLNLK